MTSVFVMTRPTLPLWPGPRDVHALQQRVIAHRVRRLAVRHAPLDRALVEIDRREHAVRRLQDRQPLHVETGAFAAAATAAAPAATARSGRRRGRRGARAWPAVVGAACCVPPRPGCRRDPGSAAAALRLRVGIRAGARGEPLAELLADDARLVLEVGESLAAAAPPTRRQSTRSRPSRTRCAFRDRSRRPASSCRRWRRPW